MGGKRYLISDASIQDAVKNSSTMADAIRKLGLRVTGGAYPHLKRRIDRLGLDTSHFKPPKSFLAPGVNKKHWSEILVYRAGKDVRQRAAVLRKALIESGRKHCCGKCGLGCVWRGEGLVLEIDHINGDWLDDREQNLEFLCPNCHSQKPYRKRPA